MLHNIHLNYSLALFLGPRRFLDLSRRCAERVSSRYEIFFVRVGCRVFFNETDSELTNRTLKFSQFYKLPGFIWLVVGRKLNISIYSDHPALSYQSVYKFPGTYQLNDYQTISRGSLILDIIIYLYRFLAIRMAAF